MTRATSCRNAAIGTLTSHSGDALFADANGDAVRST
jgi:hypothetical protein